METQTETTTTTLKPPPPIAELRAEALREDAPPIPPAAAPAPLSTKRTPTADEIEEWRSAVDIAADELVDFYPELKGVYTDERRARLAERIAAVAVKYNVTPLGFIDRYKEEIALVLFLRPLARDTMRVIEAQQKRPAPASGVQGKASEVQPPPLVAAIGARQTGKTTWIKQSLRRSRPARLLVWDPLCQYAEFGTVFTDRARLADFVGTRPTFAAIYQPGDKLSLYAARFDWFCRLAWALKDAALVIEELADVTAPNRAPDSWSAITRKGGNVGTWISAIAATQRPAEIDKTFLGNCTLVHCGRLNDEGAIVTMRRTLGVTYEDIAGLRDLEFIERNMNTGAVRRGVISLVT